MFKLFVSVFFFSVDIKVVGLCRPFNIIKFTTTHKIRTRTQKRELNMKEKDV